MTNLTYLGRLHEQAVTRVSRWPQNDLSTLNGLAGLHTSKGSILFVVQKVSFFLHGLFNPPTHARLGREVEGTPRKQFLEAVVGHSRYLRSTVIH